MNSTQVRSQNTAPASGGQPATVIPSHLAIDLIDCLAHMRSRVNEAGAAALMMGSEIANEAADGGPHDLFIEILPEFKDGVEGLAHDAITQALTAMERLREGCEAMIKRTRDHDTPVQVMQLPHENEVAILAAANLPGNLLRQCKLEDSVYRLRGLTELLGSVAGQGQSRISWVANRLSDGLRDAFEKLWVAACDVRRVTVTLEYQRQAAQRQAA